MLRILFTLLCIKYFFFRFYRSVSHGMRWRCSLYFRYVKNKMVLTFEVWFPRSDGHLFISVTCTCSWYLKSCLARKEHLVSSNLGVYFKLRFADFLKHSLKLLLAGHYTLCRLPQRVHLWKCSMAALKDLHLLWTLASQSLWEETAFAVLDP